jgi:hypothetical protein
MFYKIEKFILNLRSGHINDTLIKKTNIIYHGLSIIFIFRNIELTEILYFNEKEIIHIIKGLQYTLLALLSLNLFIRNQYLYILNFLFLSILLNIKYGYNVEDLMFQITSFWLIFINASRIKLTRNIIFWNNNLDRSGYVFLFGLNISITIFISGIGKLLDPIWLGNYGMYYLISLPWISITYLADSIRDNEILIILISKLAVVFELIVLPLYIIKRFRLIAISLLFVFWISLLFPLRLDFIGPIGIISVLYLLSQQKVLN